MSDFKDLILKRESCRNYSEKTVDTALILKCVEAARLAPSACNSQPWKYYIVNDEKNAEKVRQCVQPNGANKFTEKCPAFAIVTEQTATLKPHVAARVHSQKWAENDIGLSVAHYCLQAADLGLGTCIIGMVEEDKMRELLGINDKIRLVIATGYSADEKPRNKVRKPIDEVCEVIE
ncbi:MAG: nitroreductase family protein [Candidatus Fimenecus sp.]